MRYRLIVAGLLAGFAPVLGAGLVGSALAAQDVRDLDAEDGVVRSFTGQIVDAPVRFSITVPAGSMMQIDVMATSELDPLLRVFDAATNVLITADDDGGDDLNARASVVAEAERRIVIEVDSFSYEGFAGEESLAAGGSFDLRLTLRDYQPQPARQVGWGDRLTGSLTAGEEHLFRFAGEAGLLLEVALAAEESTGLDPYLELRGPTGAVLASNDDGGGGLNALLRHVLEDDAEYTLAASSFGQSSGTYTLRVAERREPVPQSPVQVIGLGESASGRLGLGYENGSLEPAFISYQLDDAARAAIVGGAGEITFRMEAVPSADPDFANSLDPFLELGFETPLGFAVVASDDDGAGGLDAVLPVNLRAIADDPALLDRLRVRVRGFGPSEGEYILNAAPGLQPRAPDE